MWLLTASHGAALIFAFIIGRAAIHVGGCYGIVYGLFVASCTSKAPQLFVFQNPESHGKRVSSPGTTATSSEIMVLLKATLWKPFPASLMFWPQSPQLCRVLCWSCFIILSATPVGFHENECVGKPEKLTLHQPVNTRLGEGAVLARQWNASHYSFPK